MPLDPDIAAHYEQGDEADRLAGGFPSGPLELARTQELVARYLPPPPAVVLDVGGGPGVYARWLGDRGYRAHVVDPIPLHVEQATGSHRQVTAELGDARTLSQAGGSADVVLLLGPLYHLVEPHDRVMALREAARVLRPGGLLVAAGISRFAGLLDLLIRLDRLHEPGVGDLVDRAVATGVHAGAEHGLFTTSYFHRPDELRSEISGAAFEVLELYNVEGPGFVFPDFSSRWADPSRRAAILEPPVSSRPSRPSWACPVTCWWSRDDHRTTRREGSESADYAPFPAWLP